VPDERRSLESPRRRALAEQISVVVSDPGLHRGETTTCGAKAGPTFDPVDRRAGLLDDGWMPHTAAAAAFVVLMGTSRESAAIAMQMGWLPYDRSTFERVAHLVGERLVDDHAAIEQHLIEAFDVSTCQWPSETDPLWPTLRGLRWGWVMRPPRAPLGGRTHPSG
jgi:hypothetical protein